MRASPAGLPADRTPCAVRPFLGPATGIGRGPRLIGARSALPAAPVPGVTMLERIPSFTPTRDAGLRRLADFLPRAGRGYAARRNVDDPDDPSVSGLSPWLRHRLITEAEVLDAVAPLGPEADRFRSEVWWRIYWKGWLEMRPGVWADYRQGVRAGLNRVATEAGLRAQVEAACRGETGIDAFDHWARSLAARGWLHNHARMSFASIWIFTLRLPWELGADFFLRHLIDGDPASNTLSWRWVAGIQTVGKPYVVTPEAVEACTAGRFRPGGLAVAADPLPARPLPALRPVPQGDALDPADPAALLLHEDDLSPDVLHRAGLRPLGTAFLDTTGDRSPLAVSGTVAAFAAGAMRDTAARLGDGLGAPGPTASGAGAADALARWAAGTGALRIVTPYAPVGPAAATLRALESRLHAQGQRLVRVLRDDDAALWPLATHGYHRFREALLRRR